MARRIYRGSILVGDKTLGECARSGFVVKAKDLVSDGQIKGLLVHRGERDPKHPQEYPTPYRLERHTMPAPEVSVPPGEGAEAPALTFDETGKLI